MKVWISGALGFMGREVANAVCQAGHEIAGGIDPGHGSADFPLYASFADVQEEGGVIIDFSSPAALDDVLAFAVSHKVPAVLATTGYTDEQLARIDEAARHVALFRSANMSVGVALLRALSKKAAQVLGDTFDIEIIEAHHNRKKDAPSGTALMLLDAVQSGLADERTAVHGRSGRDAKRTKGEIGVHAVRGGTVTGEHDVCFFGLSERIRISHSAENRGVFASGAVRAAAWLEGREPGLYSMDDVMGEIL